MRINNLSYLLKEGIRGIFRHGFLSVAAVCVTVACLLIVGSVGSFMYNVNVLVGELNQTNEVMVYIEETLSDAQAKSVGTRLNLLDNIHNARFVSREQALEDFIADHDGDPAFAGVDAQMLRHRYLVVLEDNSRMRDTVTQIQTVPGVAEVKAYYELAEGFTTIQKILELIFAGVLVVLLVVSLLIISNTVKIAMYDRRDEISVMKMVGATNGFIRIPFVVEGLVLGMTGATIAFFLQWLLYDMLLHRMQMLDGMGLFQFVPFGQLALGMIGVFAAAGAFVGLMGSFASIRKYLNV